ncbi:MAG TPA: ABC transporter substrate-binding protein [Clostridiaceae bacterium]|nr:ABC transporter substrate-binding protein [Clostridiaceae bacterium]
MKRIIALLVLILMIFASFTGCISKKNNSDSDKTNIYTQKEDVSSQDNNSSGKNIEKDIYPLTVKDAKGFEMVIEKKPERIISLTLCTDELLVSLVDKSRIAGITYLSEDPGLSNIVDFAKDFPNKVSTKLESLLALEPDFIFVADWTDEKLVSQLREANILVYAYITPNSIDEQKNMIEEIATIVGEIEKGKELIKWMDDKLNSVNEKLKNLKEEDKLVALSLDSFFDTYGNNTPFHDVATRAGLINGAAKSGETGWYQMTKEKVIEINPDIIFLPSWSYEGFDADKFAEDFINDKSLQGTNAIKNGKVYKMNEALVTSVSQNMVLGVEYLAKLAYPELFEQ